MIPTTKHTIDLSTYRGQLPKGYARLAPNTTRSGLEQFASKFFVSMGIKGQLTMMTLISKGWDKITIQDSHENTYNIDLPLAIMDRLKEDVSSLFEQTFSPSGSRKKQTSDKRFIEQALLNSQTLSRISAVKSDRQGNVIEKIEAIKPLVQNEISSPACIEDRPSSNSLNKLKSPKKTHKSHKRPIDKPKIEGKKSSNKISKAYNSVKKLFKKSSK